MIKAEIHGLTKKIAREQAEEATLFLDPREQSLAGIGANVADLLEIAFIEGARWERARAALEGFK